MNPKNLSELIADFIERWEAGGYYMRNHSIQSGFIDEIVRETARATIEAVRPEIPKGMRPIFDDIEFDRKATAFMGEK